MQFLKDTALVVLLVSGVLLAGYRWGGKDMKWAMECRALLDGNMHFIPNVPDPQWTTDAHRLNRRQAEEIERLQGMLLHLHMQLQRMAQRGSSGWRPSGISL